MKKCEKNIWFIPLISAFLNIISFFIPIAIQITGRSIFIVGLQFSNVTGLYFVQNEFLLLFSFFTTAIIILLTYSLLKIVYRLYNSMKDKANIEFKKYWFAWILIGIFLIISIYFYISFDFWDRFDFTWDYWNSYQFNGAMIILYISGVWMVLSGVFLKLLDYYNFI